MAKIHRNKGRKNLEKKIKTQKKKLPNSSFSLAKYWKERKDVFKFLASFILLVLLLFAFSVTDVFDIIRDPLINNQTWMSGQLLNIFSYDTIVQGATLSTNEFVIVVSAGCDGVAPMILFWTTIAVFPIKWAYKWQGLLFGTFFLLVLNIIRIVTLFLIGLHKRNLFDFFHVEVWQIIFIAMTIFVWLYWYSWAQKKMRMSISS